jgi:hypothetical protein
MADQGNVDELNRLFQDDSEESDFEGFTEDEIRALEIDFLLLISPVIVASIQTAIQAAMLMISA